MADILVRPVPLSAPVGAGRLFHVDPIEATTGGIVCNSGIAMRRLGLRVAAASLGGTDPWDDSVRSRGVMLSQPAGAWIEIPCVPAFGPVADTTGGGDSFLTDLPAGIVRGVPLRDGGFLGAATAACCVTGLGGGRRAQFV